MTIALQYDSETGEFDLLLADDGSLSEGDPLVIAVILSLHTDAAVQTADGPIGGSWMDAYPDEPGDVFGSTLWYVLRNGVTADTAQQAEEAAQKSLAWLTWEKLARSIEVAATRTQAGRIDLDVTVVRPDGTIVRV